MTTGRINQVTAEIGRRPGPREGTGRLRWRLGVCWIAAPKMIVEQNASSHGFRTCPYLAPRRRQDPVAANELALRGVPPIVGFAAPAQPTDLYQIRSFAPARLAGGFCFRVLSVPSIGLFGGLEWQPSIRTTRDQV